MTTTDYLFSKGYTATEVEAIMREIYSLDLTAALADPVVAEWVAADPYADEAEEFDRFEEAMSDRFCQECEE